MKYLKVKKLPIFLVIIADILLVGVILLVFAFFHHVLPAMITQFEISMQQNQPKPSTEATIQPTETMQTEPIVETTIVTEPDNRTEWQKKFEDKFTEEIIMTENSYSSPEVSIKVDTVVVGEGSKKITYYVADIYIASMDNFKTYTAHGEMKYFDTQPAEEMAADSNAILAISGDFLTYQKTGFLVRNGETYVANRNYSICAMFPDGSMETYDFGSYNIDDIMARNPVQVWSFGPVLLDSDGSVREKYDVSTAVGYPNPRCAIGYYEPGHYCFVTVDGRRNGHSAGMEIPELAQVFVDLGCKVAYNLDGGGTAVMLFDGEKISKQSNGNRDLGDILLITEMGYSVHSLEGSE